MLTVRVLFLDYGELLPKILRQVLVNSGINLEIIRQESIGGEEDVYANSPATLRKITEFTQQGVDCIIIGNNLDAGVPKARAVVPAMRGKTIIAWTDYRPGDEWDYLVLGFEHFCSRGDLPQMIAEMLGADK